MRAAGAVGSSRGLGAHDHVCWAYDDPDEFGARAVDFLSDGLAQGLRVQLVAPGSAADLRARLGEADDLRDALARGAASVVSTDDAYGSGATTNPLAQVAHWAAATEAALAAGYRGLRIAADATVLVTTPSALDTFARYEHMVDRFMVHRPFSALCAYHRRELGDASIAALSCMHPIANDDGHSFGVFATASPGIGVRGEIDMRAWALLPAALERADPVPADGRIVVDCSALGFVDHRGLLALEAHARRAGATVVLRSPRGVAARLVEMLEIEGVRVEVSA